MIGMVGKERRVYGVGSWVFFSNGATYCEGGSTYATFGRVTKAFIEKALTWVDACAGIPERGKCSKGEAIRCTKKGEGARRATRTSCKTLGLTCGFDTTGEVACIDK